MRVTNLASLVFLLLAVGALISCTDNTVQTVPVTKETGPAASRRLMPLASLRIRPIDKNGKEIVNGSDIISSEALVANILRMSQSADRVVVKILFDGEKVSKDDAEFFATQLKQQLAGRELDASRRVEIAVERSTEGLLPDEPAKLS